jgi:uncharacterized protein (TIGR03435 family)
MCLRFFRAVPVLLALLAAQQPAFEVASIHPSRSSERSAIVPYPNGRFTATNTTARSLILRAYGLVDAQLVGGPPWLDVERYDIDARAAVAPADGPESLLPFVRALLIERFQLKTHSDMRELPAYALTFARRDRQLGPQIRATEANCTRATSLNVDELRSAVRDGWPPCGMVYVVSFATSSPDGTNIIKMRVRRSGITSAALATALQSSVERPVVDETGLSGRFDVEYSFAPQPPATAGADSAFGAPMLLVALEEQLGLKLDSRRISVPVVVIDSIDRPTEN